MGKYGTQNHIKLFIFLEKVRVLVADMKNSQVPEMVVSLVATRR